MARAAPILVALLCLPAAAAVADSRLLQISDKAPPCEEVADLPIVPNDPAAMTAPGGQRRCYGTRPVILEARLPLDRMVWLTRSPDHPAEWIFVGPVLVDAKAVAPAPLGLRLRTGDDDTVTLETRYEQFSTITPLAGDAWQQVRTADGATLWVRVRPPD